MFAEHLLHASSVLEKSVGLHYDETLLKNHLQHRILENYSQINSLFTLPIAVEKIVICVHKFIDNANILAILQLFQRLK